MKNENAKQELLKLAAEGGESPSMAHHARKSENYFVAENLKEIDGKISSLKYCLLKLQGKYEEAGNCDVPYWVRGAWFAPQRRNLPLFYLDFCEVLQPQEGRREATEKEIKALISFYEQIKADFSKRLKTYLKRYGLVVFGRLRG